MMKALGALLAAALLNTALALPADAGKPATVWKDVAGDAGPQESPTPGFTEAGFDIVSGSIVRNKNNLEFTVTHEQMPPYGNFPETFRFMWAFTVGKTIFRITVKRVDVGKPDVAQEQTTERVGRVDANGHFRLEGDCGSNVVGAVNFINCKPLAYLEGSYDTGKKSFTMVIPMKLIKAKTGSVITAGGGDAATICQICWVSHLAERSSDATLIDSAVQTGSYKVPK